MYKVITKQINYLKKTRITMNLEEKINEDIKEAMLAKDAKKLEALRAIKSAVLLAKTGKGVEDGKISGQAEMQGDRDGLYYRRIYGFSGSVPARY